LPKKIKQILKKKKLELKKMTNELSLVKELREKTGAGFLDCKIALKENSNNIELSIDFLRKKGLAKASKKSNREANEGAIGFYSNSIFSIILKINSETDFAAKSDTFLNFMDYLGHFAINLNNPNLTKEKFLKSNDNGKLIDDFFTEMIAKIGENIILSDLLVIEHEKSYISHYVHNPYRKNIGKIISIINFECNNKNDEINILSKNICMHIAALKPEALNIEDLDKEIIDKEKNIQKELIKSSGKPEKVVEKILEGKMKKYFSEITLMNQSYVIEPEKTIQELVNEYMEKYDFNIKSFKIAILS
tara:strand:+ start:856 stop:1770 length:915 start_codon:yes stop_codon:yes gene_type:complete